MECGKWTAGRTGFQREGDGGCTGALVMSEDFCVLLRRLCQHLCKPIKDSCIARAPL